MVVGTAGTTAAGVIDPLEDLADVCRTEGTWFHVDAAWGGAATLSRRLSGALAGIERADSITCDAHKWLSVPMGAGMFFCRHRDAVLESFRVSTHYMPGSTDETIDPYAASIQWSRRSIGLKVFLSFATLGVRGVEAMIDHQADMGDRLRADLRSAGWEILNETCLPVVCFTHPGIRGELSRAKRVADRVVASGEAWISHVVLSDGRPALRACISSFRTSPADLERLSSALELALQDD